MFEIFEDNVNGFNYQNNFVANHKFLEQKIYQKMFSKIITEIIINRSSYCHFFKYSFEEISTSIRKYLRFRIYLILVIRYIIYQVIIYSVLCFPDTAL